MEAIIPTTTEYSVLTPKLKMLGNIEIANVSIPKVTKSSFTLNPNATILSIEVVAGLNLCAGIFEMAFLVKKVNIMIKIMLVLDSFQF